MRLRRSAPSRPGGFTLVELVLVMVLVGIVGTLGATFVSRAVEIYRTTVARVELADQANTALRRLARDLAAALPNSVRVTVADGGTYLEFVPVVSAGRYRAFGSVAAEPGGNDPLDLEAVPPDTSFQVIGVPVDAAAGNWLVVYNLGNPQSDAYEGSNRKALSVSGSALATLSWASGGTAFPLHSPDQRFFVVDAPVTYFCGPDGVLTRYAGYGWSSVQPTLGGGGLAGATSVARLASQASACAFAIDAGMANIGSVQVTLGLSRGGETVTLFQQVNYDATP